MSTAKKKVKKESLSKTAIKEIMDSSSADLERAANTTKTRRGSRVKLKPGIEMDRFIATDLLKWKITKVCPPIAPGMGNPLTYYLRPGKDSEEILRRFSSSDAAALELFQIVRKLGIFCCLTISSDLAYCYDVMLTIDPFVKGGSRHGNDVCVTRESLAEAICVAIIEGFNVYREIKGNNDA